MTLHNRYLVFSVLSSLVLATAGLADDQAGQVGESSQTGQMEGMEEQAGSPKQVCENLVQAAKKNDWQSFSRYTLGMGGGQAGQAGEPGMEEKAKKEMSKAESKMKGSSAQMSKLKNLSCGSEHVAGTHAVVEAESQGEKRLIPFVQEDGMWKFDPNTYSSFYKKTS